MHGIRLRLTNLKLQATFLSMCRIPHAGLLLYTCSRITLSHAVATSSTCSQNVDWRCRPGSDESVPRVPLASAMTHIECHAININIICSDERCINKATAIYKKLDRLSSQCYTSLLIIVNSAFIDTLPWRASASTFWVCLTGHQSQTRRSRLNIKKRTLSTDTIRNQDSKRIYDMLGLQGKEKNL